MFDYSTAEVLQSVGTMPQTLNLVLPGLGGCVPSSLVMACGGTEASAQAARGLGRQWMLCGVLCCQLRVDFVFSFLILLCLHNAPLCVCRRYSTLCYKMGCVLEDSAQP